MFKKIDIVLKSWVTAISWFIVGHTLYKIVQLINWSHALSWSEKFGINQSQLLQVLGSHAFIFALCYLIFRPRSSFTFLGHVKLSRMLYFPPTWLFFWAGYLYEYIIHFLAENPIIYGRIQAALVLAIIIFLIWKYVFVKFLLKPTYKVRTFRLDLKNDILSHNNYQKNEALLERLRVWACQEQIIDDNSEDLFGVGPVIEQVKQYVEANIKNNEGILIGVVDVFGMGKSNILVTVMNDMLYEYKNKLVLIKISCSGPESSENIERYIVNRIFYEVKKRVDVTSFVDLPNHWLEFVKGFTDSKLPDYLQSKFEQTPLVEMIRDLGQLIANGDLQFVIVLEEIEKCKSISQQIDSLHIMLQNLKKIQGITVIVLFDTSMLQHNGQGSIDYNFICDRLVYVPAISIKLIEKIFNLMCFTLGPDDKNWDINRAKHFPMVVEQISEDEEWESVDSREFAWIARSPRKLQRFICHVCNRWNVVKGHINFYDFFLISYINEYFPTVINFLITHIDLISLLIKQKKRNKEKVSRDALILLSKAWQDVYIKIPLEKQFVARKILAMLFKDIWIEIDEQINLPDYVYQVPTAQRITDSLKYWQVALEGRLFQAD